MSRTRRSRFEGWRPAVVLILIAFAAFAVRCIGLEHRPVHGDEANQAYKTGRLLETGRYIYDPRDHHGPTLYYYALAPLAAFQVHSTAEVETWMLRLVPVAFSAATILLLIPLRLALPPGAAVCAGLFLAFSPAFTFYSRYFIQEELLVFFTFAALVAGWFYAQRATAFRAIHFALALCLMHATKETAALAYAAMALSAVLTLSWRFGPRAALARTREHLRARHLLPAVLLGVVLSVTLFTAFYTHWRGPLDSILTYGNYFEKAGGTKIHDKPWFYYLQLLLFTHRGPGPAWSEAVVLLLALAGTAIAFWPLSKMPRAADTLGRPWLLRFLAIYTWILGAMYSAVPYKTPWTLLSFYFGVVLLAGIASAHAIRLAPRGWRRAAVVAAFGVALAHLGVQGYRSETEYAADVRNPWVYAHTSNNLVELVERIDALAAIHPSGRKLLVRVIQPDNDYWPLPWYLRRYPNVGYWNEIPVDVEADIIVSSPLIGENLRGRLHGGYFGPSIYSLRPAALRELYVKQELWDAFMAGREAADPAL